MLPCPLMSSKNAHTRWESPILVQDFQDPLAPVENIYKNDFPRSGDGSTEIAQTIKHEDEKDAVDSAIVCGNVQRKPEWKYFTANCQCSSKDLAKGHASGGESGM